MPIEKAHLRIARATDHLPEIIRFYRDGLGFEVIGSFEDHDGFHGVMLGRHGLPYHLEFTSERGNEAGRAPTQDNLLVFYLPDSTDWQQSVNQMLQQGYKPVIPYNPYWQARGETFEDADGYRVCKTLPALATTERRGPYRP